jgi:hypothetical protein
MGAGNRRPHPRAADRPRRRRARIQYTSTAQTFTEAEPITDVGARLGWTIVSMARDWDVVFPPAS